MNRNKKIPLRLWRMSHDEFTKTVKPVLSSWKEQNIQILYSMVVDGVSQKKVGEIFNVSRQSAHGILRRGYKNYTEANPTEE